MVKILSRNTMPHREIARERERETSASWLYAKNGIFNTFEVSIGSVLASVGN